MHVLMVGAKTCPPVLGGIETHVFEVSRRLVGKGVDVDVVVPRLAGEAASEDVEGIEVKRVACIQTRYSLKLSSIPGILTILRKHDGVVHAHDATGGFACAGLGDASRLVYTMHGLGFHPKDWPTPFRQGIRILQATALKKAKHVFCTDEISAKSIRDMRPNAELLSNGVDIDVFAPRKGSRPETYDPSRFVFLYVGRMSAVKGVDTLLSAIAALDENTRRSLEFVFIGDGPMKRTVEEASRKFTEIRPLGTVPHDRIAPYFAHADAYVLPSLSEGLPVSLIEAMASGLPSIASNVGGIQSQTEPGSLLLLPPGDAASLKDAIALVVEDRSMRATMSKRARELVEQRFSWERVVERLVRVYGDLESVCPPRDMSPRLVLQDPAH